MQTLVNNDKLKVIFGQHFNRQWLQPLLNKPNGKIGGNYMGKNYIAHLIIPDYTAHINRRYGNVLKGDLIEFCGRVELPLNFVHFGVVIKFNDAVELCLHNDELVMDDGLRQLIADVGTVIIKNAYMSHTLRKVGHRNRFPHLNFHIDRTAKQVTYYSMYARDPFDDEQKYPRTSSTLFIPNIVGYLQGMKDGLVDPLKDKGIKATYQLFENDSVDDLINDLIIEHRWDEPCGIGEISVLDNTTLLHSSYYRNFSKKGYKIGVRYLA